MTMIKTPLRFLEVDQEFFLPDPAKFRHAKLCETPEGLDTVDMVFSTGKFILMVVDSMVSVAVGHQSIVGFPTIGIDIAALYNSALKNRHKFSLGAVLHNTHKYSSLPFVQTKNLRFSASPASALSTNSFGPKVTFINLDIPDKWPSFLDGQIHDSVAKKGINALGSFAIKTDQNRSRGRGNIHRKTPYNPAELNLGNVRLFLILVLQ